ncbi:MAG: penicillin-binding transpeptidase domain-containing protein [Thermoflexales bacterium]
MPPPTAPAMPTVTTAPTLTAAARTMEQFVDALNARDYVAAFNLLGAQAQSVVQNSEGLRSAYLQMQQRSLSADFHARLVGGLLQTGNRATAQLVTEWRSRLLGSFTLTTTLMLVNENNGWFVDWTRDAIVPGWSNGTLVLRLDESHRGDIVASDGQLLATRRRIEVVGVQPSAITDPATEQAMLNLLSSITGLTPVAIRQRYSGAPPHWFVPIADVDSDVLDANSDALSEFPAVIVRSRWERYYPEPDLAPHVIGFVGPIPAESLSEYQARGYRGSELVGRIGLEASLEDTLAGQPGAELVLFGAGEPQVIARRAPQPARDVRITLLPKLQRQVQNLLGKRRGAAVVLRADDGAVLALASSPTFSVTQITTGVIASGALLNRATQGVYPPGSSFKMVTMAAGLAEGIARADEVFFDPGFWDGFGAAFRKTCWLRGGHGRITLQNALTASCNVVFYELGRRLDRLSPEKLSEYARRFGFGQATGVGIAEAEGLVPDPQWKRQLLGEVWTGGDTVNMAIGQGFLLVTPIQVAQMTLALARGGQLIRPYLVAEPTQPRPPVTQLMLSDVTLQQIQAAMTRVTTDARYGTAAYRFANFDYCLDAVRRWVRCGQLPTAQRRAARQLKVAGKSGTAQAGGDAKPFAWFTAYAPAEQPEIVVTVLLENIGEGSNYAAPLVRQVVEAYYGLPISPTPTDIRAND